MSNRYRIKIHNHLDQAADCIKDLKIIGRYIEELQRDEKSPVWSTPVAWPRPLTDEEEEACQVYLKGKGLVSYVEAASLMTERYGIKWTVNMMRRALERRSRYKTLQWILKAKEAGLL